MSNVVIVSGYFNPLHEGHVEYFKLAKEYAGENGKLIAIVNSDYQSILKKKYSFVPERDRMAVISALKYVDKAILSIDRDRSVCETIRKLIDDKDFGPITHFANGGDVTENSKCPEEIVCNQHNVKLVYGLGDKIQSSSWILESSVQEYCKYHTI